MLWAYFSFSQFLIIWAGNLPEEIPYYLERMTGGWKYLSLVLIFGHFGLPFCLLLSADLKKRPNLLARVAWFIIAIRLYDIIWLVAPAFNKEGFPISLANIGVPLALAGAWLFLFCGQLRKHAAAAGERPVLQEDARATASWGALRCRRTNRNIPPGIRMPITRQSDINLRAIIWFVVVLAVIVARRSTSRCGACSRSWTGSRSATIRS